MKPYTRACGYCPLCGHDRVQSRRIDPEQIHFEDPTRPDMDGHRVFCPFCYAEVRCYRRFYTSLRETREAAEARWNRRDGCGRDECPMCGDVERVLFDANARWLGPQPQVIRFARCSGCGLVVPGFVRTVEFWRRADPLECFRQRRARIPRECCT